jgi:hypothetical protein
VSASHKFAVGTRVVIEGKTTWIKTVMRDIEGGYQVDPEVSGFSLWNQDQMQVYDGTINISDPVELERASKLVEALRADILGDGELAGSSVMADPHVRIAISLLEQAAQNLKLASYHQAQRNAAGRSSW